ncbi:N-acetylmuramoyl-L-alanine amidase [Gordonia sihwensis]|uniref:N-acetylmuramoyl-L-alanine amidase n=1 Tax=Gordonia sihwensis TaxID=173559 RepID=UPI003D988680
MALLADGRGTIERGSAGADSPLAHNLLPVGVKTIYYDVAGGRSAVEVVNGRPSAVDALAGLPEADCYVAAIGTNDGANIASGSAIGAEERIERLQAATSGKPLYMLTISVGSNTGISGYGPDAAQKFNDAIKAKLPADQVIPWAERASDELRAEDGIHDTPDGTNARAQTVGVFFAGANQASKGGDVATPAAEESCAPVIALDPGHNPDDIQEHDPVTKALMVDYPNGAEDKDVMAVALAARDVLEKRGYRVVLLKSSVEQSLSYRERVDRAEKAGAVLGVSIHTSVNDNAIFPQRLGNYRQGPGPDGADTIVQFSNAATATKSEKYSAVFAQARSNAEGHGVVVRNNTFDGRPPLWRGNLPIISLLASKIPWVYNEFGTPTAGGTKKIPNDQLAKYATGLVAGVIAAVPNTCDAAPATPKPTAT